MSDLRVMTTEFIEELKKLNLVRLGPERRPQKIALPRELGEIHATNSKIDEDLQMTADYGVLYDVGVRIGRRIWLVEPAEVDPATTQIQKEVTRLVYGPVRDKIRDLYALAYDLRPTNYSLAKRLESRLSEILAMMEI